LHLGDLRKGARARVTSVDGGSPIRVRLLELGFVPGTEVVCLGAAPLGDPLLFLVRGARMAIRAREAAGVRVAPLAEPQP
jgi:ferrous iron transport protein A